MDNPDCKQNVQNGRWNPSKPSPQRLQFDGFRALQPGFETPNHQFPGCLIEGSVLPLKAEARSLWVEEVQISSTRFQIALLQAQSLDNQMRHTCEAGRFPQKKSSIVMVVVGKHFAFLLIVV